MNLKEGIQCLFIKANKMKKNTGNQEKASSDINIKGVYANLRVLSRPLYRMNLLL